MTRDDDPSPSPTATGTTTSSTARDRASQISQHITPSATNTRRRRRKSNKDDPPADYSDILTQLQTLRTIAKTPDPQHPGYSRQKASGKLWVRERVTRLFDAGTFREVGSVSGDVTWRPLSATKEGPVDFVPSNNVQGFGRLGGRKVLFTADDFTLRAGHADGAIGAKTVYMEKLALALKLPMVKLVDGSSGGGSVSSIRTMGYSYIPPLESFEYVMKQLNQGIPNLGAVLGPAIGLGAARVVSCHFSVMAADVGALFNAGPKVVAGATFEEGLTFRDLGGPMMHCTNGTIDNLAASEEECFEQIRTILAYLPDHGQKVPPTMQADDDQERLSPELRTAIPRKRERMFEPRKIITTVVDKSSFFEIGRLWGTTVVIGLARLGGRPVGIVANNPETNAGALDAAGSQKLTRHLKFLDIFNIPLLQFVDVPGYAVGTVAERTATMRWGVELAKTYYATTMPIFSVIVRRVYGVAGGVMLDCRDPRLRVAWPSGEWGSLPLDGGIEAGHAAELKKIEREKGTQARKDRYKELDDEYRRLMSPIRTANAFGVEEIIDPARTRPLVCEWLQHTYENLLPIRVQERTSGKLQPVFS
ncbi:Acetyl-CoA carboxylase-like protein 1 [Elsinoe fawcettii]|nr:Acetyl-CoA carboxylase-like protein 1 [Elsinoe fawcettii]